jgi:hypothetical protein
MGYYIETDKPLNKAQILLDSIPSAREVTRNKLDFDVTGRTVIVCVVNNGPFDAAAICYSLNELRAFNEPTDYRPKRWLVIPRDEVVKLNRSVADKLPKVL